MLTTFGTVLFLATFGVATADGSTVANVIDISNYKEKISNDDAVWIIEVPIKSRAQFI
jgi:hypothetical protein